MDNLSFEQKVAKLVMAKTPQEKVDLINRWKNDPEFYYGVNANTLPLEQLLKQDKYKAVTEHVKNVSDNLLNRGWNKSKTSKHIGEIPADIFFNRPEFHQSNPNWKKNIKDFLVKFPQFRVSK